MASTTNGVNGTADKPKLTLYTNHNCPYAQRAHITLDTLGLPYEEVIIDLGRPRDPWYLEVNPRGLVPSLKISHGSIKDQILTESAIVAQFLVDLFPSHLLPPSNAGPEAALTRARINFFTDTWTNKVSSLWFGTLMATGAEAEEKAQAWLAALEKEIEPLLADAKPFFGGSSELTFAEVFAGPFILRWYSLANGGVLPKSVLAGFNKLPNFSKWAEAVRSNKNVTKVWDEEHNLRVTKERIEKRRAEAAAKK